MIELSKRLIYESCSLARVPHLKEDMATVRLHQFLQYRDKNPSTVCMNKVTPKFIQLVCLICTEGHTIK